MAAASSLMYVKTIPCQEITEDFENNHITIPMHEKKIKIEIDEFHLDESILVEKSLAVHLGLSIIEHILLRCPSIKYWLKNQMYPIHHIIFHDEVILTVEQEQELISIVRNFKRWPSIIFKKNSQIRQMLHRKKNSTNSAYGLYMPSGEDEDHGGKIFMNLQLIEQSAKSTKKNQCIYGMVLAIKYLHEFSHFIYSTFGRAHLLVHHGVPMKDTKYTPDGTLKGESGNKFEEAMLGFVLLHAGHANISMNIKQCLALSPITSHLRIIPSVFFEKIWKKQTYEVHPMSPNFLHYSAIEFCQLEHFSADKAADIQIFYVDDEHHGTARVYHLKLFSLDDAEQENDQLAVFFPLKDKLPRPSF